jgi:hypothetical protein
MGLIWIIRNLEEEIKMMNAIKRSPAIQALHQMVDLSQ